MIRRLPDEGRARSRMHRRDGIPASPSRRSARVRAALASAALALLAACQTTPPGPSKIPPGNADRDGPEAHPPADLDKVPDAVPQPESIRNGGPNKPYEIAGKTYVPITDDKPLTEKGLASWYGKKFHGRRTASGEAYNMYAMTAAHKTLPIPSYARVRNPSNGKEIVVRVNDRGPFSPNRVIDLSYTAALKLGVLAGVTPVEVTRITLDDIRTGAAFRKNPVLAAAPPAEAANAARAGATRVADAGAAVRVLPPMPGDVVASAAAGAASAPDVDLGAAAAADTAPSVVVAKGDEAASAPTAAPARPDAAPREEQARADTTAGIGFWLQLGAFKQRNGALDFQHKLIDEQPWLAPLMAVFTERGLNKLQAGPYASREEARSAAERVRTALQLVPTIVEKK